MPSPGHSSCPKTIRPASSASPVKTHLAIRHPTRRLLVSSSLVALVTMIALSAPDSRPVAKKSKSGATQALPSSEIVNAARERAKLLHEVYTATLDAMHHHYFRRDGSVLPARAMEDVFQKMASKSSTMANWIAVNTKAMSVQHEPTTAFEKLAAAEISAGKESVERATKRVYQRATAIPLTANCVGCHTRMFAEEPKTPRFAGLVISIPLSTEKD